MRRGALFLLLVLAVSGCGRKHARANHLPPPPLPRSSGAHQRLPQPSLASRSMQLADEDLYGYASWYGHPYHGRATANGEIYNMNDLTAAHRTLPFGTRVEVSNMENGRQVQVRINDRGPFIDGRIIDLSHRAAQLLEMIGPGTALVRLNVLGIPAEALPAVVRYGVQVGAFRDRGTAEHFRNLLSERHAPISVQQGGDLYRVYVGAEPTEVEAALLAQKLRRESLAAFVVLLP